MINNIIYYICIAYALLINFIAVVITISDKIKAKNNSWRIPERILFTVAIIGGALGEFITMKLIRHKTKHIKFMVGLPAIILLHIILIVVIILKVAN